MASHKGTKLTEEQSFSASAELDAETAEEWIGDDGFLSQHASVALPCADARGQESLMESIEAGGVKKAKKVVPRVRAKDDEEKVEAPKGPKTKYEELVESMPRLLTDASLARKHSITLTPYGLSADTIGKLDEFAIFCEKAYKQAQEIKLGKDGNPDKLLASIAQERKWFDMVTPVHDSMMKGLKAKDAKTGKGKSKGKGKGKEEPQEAGKQG